MSHKGVILQATCSEAIFCLDDVEFHIWTDGYPNGFADQLIDHKDEIKGIDRTEFITLLALGESIADKLDHEGRYEFIDNGGGGADFDYIDKVIDEFMKFKIGLISEEEFINRDKDLWGL